MSQAEIAYNNIVSRSMGKSPFAIVYYMAAKHALDLVPLLELPRVSQATKDMAN